MKVLLKKFKIQSALVSLIFIILGICLLAIPNTAKMTICYFAGALLLVSGLVQIINFFLYSIVQFGFLWGLIDVFAGIFILSSAELLAKPEVFGLMFGIVIAIKSIFEIQSAADMRKLGIKYWWLDMSYALLMLVLGVVLLFDPFAADRALTIYLAVCALVNGILGLFVNIFISGKIKKVTRSVKKEVDDADYRIEDAPEK